MLPESFETDPSQYKHWKLEIAGPIAWLRMAVQEAHPLKPGYALKLNSYDLGVDLELADAVQRLRFEHPEVTCVVVTSALAGVFSSGANIFMLSSSDACLEGQLLPVHQRNAPLYRGCVAEQRPEIHRSFERHRLGWRLRAAVGLR